VFKRKGSVFVVIILLVIAIPVAAGGCSPNPGQNLHENNQPPESAAYSGNYALLVDESRTVVEDKLLVNQTISDWAHGQHTVWIKGKVKRDAGELFLTLYDTNGNQLESSGLQKVEELKPLDNDWLSFSHRLTEDTWKVLDIQKGIILFELRKDSLVDPGKLEVPLKRPPMEYGTASDYNRQDTH